MSGRAVVIGLGRSGAACARVLAAEGDDVLVVDRCDDARLQALAGSLPDGVRVQLGGYRFLQLRKSPDRRPAAPVRRELRAS